MVQPHLAAAAHRPEAGLESYGGGADTLWYDDVAVGSSRIGC
ncbi:hypothetical protein [Micromonospora sp. WMMA1996]